MEALAPSRGGAWISSPRRLRCTIWSSRFRCLSSHFRWSKSDSKLAMSVCAISSSLLSTLELRRGAMSFTGRISFCEVHGFEEDEAVAHSKAAELLLLVEHALDDCRKARLLHRPD